MPIPLEPLDCVAFMLIRDNHILVERRSLSKQLLPGVLAIPGGHVNVGESVEQALVRELFEELGIVPQRYAPVCTLLHEAEEHRRLYYFAVEQWTGTINAQEADSIQWLPLDDLTALALDVDRVAIERYLSLVNS